LNNRDVPPALGPGRKRISSAGPGQMIFNSPTPYRTLHTRASAHVLYLICNWYTYGASTFTFFIYVLFFFLLSFRSSFLLSTKSRTRRPTLRFSSPWRTNRWKITRTGWSISRCRAPLLRTATGLIDGPLTPAWHTRSEQMRLVRCVYTREKRKKHRTEIIILVVVYL
jgi:hypothetical protein